MPLGAIAVSVPSVTENTERSTRLDMPLGVGRSVTASAQIPHGNPG
jgi:hypothetical protein